MTKVEEESHNVMKEQIKPLWDENQTVKSHFLEHRTCCVCGSNSCSHPYFKSMDGFHYIKCYWCGFVFVESILNKKGWTEIKKHTKNYFGQESKVYTEHSLTPEGQLSDRKRFSHYLNTIEEYTFTKGSILDIGSHTGNFLSLAKERGWDVTGVEGGKERTKIANRRGLRTIHGFFDNIDCQKISSGRMLDVVTVWETLEHVEDPEEFISNIGDVLVKGGLVAFTVPNVNSIKIRLQKEKCTDCFGVGHINLFSSKTLTQFLERHDYEVLYCKNHGTRGGGFKDKLKDIRDFLGLGPLVFCIARRQYF